VFRLTNREVEIVRALIQGKSNKNIAEVLVISEATVEGHLHRIYRKLGVRSRAQAIVCVLRLGLDNL